MATAEGPSDWIFLRGLMRESAHWDDFPERFAGGIPGARTVLLDLPGNGMHCHLPSSTSIPAMMEFARREAWAFGLSADSFHRTPVHLLAISLGAMVAIEWLRRHPSEISGAVLINTSLRGFCPCYRRLAWRAWPLLMRIALQRDARARERALMELTSTRGLDDPARLETRVRACRAHPFRRLNAVRQLWAAATYRPPQQPPRAPLLLLNARNDRLVDPACSETMARRWELPLMTHPWAGHDLPIDDAGWVIGRVSDWLETMGPSSAEAAATSRR